MFPTIGTAFGGTSYSRSMPDKSEVFNFGDLEMAIEAIAIEQVDGMFGPKTACGVTYSEVNSMALARPGDEKIIEKIVCTDFLTKIIGFIDAVQLSRNPVGGKIRLEWRIRPMFEVGNYPVVVKYEENGPDVDGRTDKRCVKDNDWNFIKVRARVAVVPAN